MSFSFKRAERISLKRDFDLVFTQGKKVVHRDFILWFYSKDSPIRRLGILASRKLGGAVERNRFKRLVRETFRLHKHQLKEGLDVLIYPRPGRCHWKNYGEAENSLLSGFQRSGLLK